MNSIKIEDILQSFYEISGMDIAIVNSKYRIIARRYSSALYCSVIHRSPVCYERCVESDQCNLNAARKKRGLHVYKCPFGIYEALVPIFKNEEVVAYVFVGMGVEDNEESVKALYDNALNVSPTLNKKALLKGVTATPRFTKEKLDAFATMLPLIAEYIEANNLLIDADLTIGQLVKTYVKNNLSKKITLNDIAWKLHCSTVTLTEHFKREYGITIMEYVMKKRMEKAERMLMNSELSISEISEECGFPDIEYFSRCFKNLHGMSPSSWKKLYGVTVPKKSTLRINLDALPENGLLEPEEKDEPNEADDKGESVESVEAETEKTSETNVAKVSKKGRGKKNTSDGPDDSICACHE